MTFQFIKLTFFFPRWPRHNNKPQFSSRYQCKWKNKCSSDWCSTHHHRLWQTLVWRADGAQRTSKQAPQRWGQRGGRQGQAVQLCVGSFPERPVDQRALPLEGLLLGGLCCWIHIHANALCLQNTLQKRAFRATANLHISILIVLQYYSSEMTSAIIWLLLLASAKSWRCCCRQNIRHCFGFSFQFAIRSVSDITSKYKYMKSTSTRHLRGCSSQRNWSNMLTVFLLTKVLLSKMWSRDDVSQVWGLKSLNHQLLIHLKIMISSCLF